MCQNVGSFYMSDHYQQSQLQIMKNFQDENYQLWKSKWQLTKEGDTTITTELKQHLGNKSQLPHLLLTCNLKTLLEESKLYQIQKDETYGSYQLYSKVPTFLLLSGHAMIQCINMEGDNQILVKVEKSGVLQTTESLLKSKYGQSNITLITQFEIVGIEKSIIVELSPKSTFNALKYLDQSKVSLKEEIIMRKYMLIALKHITKLVYTKGTNLNEKFYLLEGRICYYHAKNKNMLVCYEEGYFNPQQFNSTDIKMHVFEGSILMILQSEMLKDEVATGVESKREEHINNLVKNYEKMSTDQISKLQQKLISKYKLSKKEVEKQILGIEKVATQKLNKTKTDLTTTNTSIKDSMREKCGIRIRKTKKN